MNLIPSEIIIEHILPWLSYPDLVSYCLVNHYTDSICDDHFWKCRLDQDFYEIKDNKVLIPSNYVNMYYDDIISWKYVYKRWYQTIIQNINNVLKLNHNTHNFVYTEKIDWDIIIMKFDHIYDENETKEYPYYNSLFTAHYNPHIDIEILKKLYFSSIIHNNLKILNKLYTIKPQLVRLDPDIYKQFIHTIQIQTLHWLKTHIDFGIYDECIFIEYAIMYSRFDILKYLNEAQIPEDNVLNIIFTVIKNGYVTIQWNKLISEPYSKITQYLNIEESDKCKELQWLLNHSTKSHYEYLIPKTRSAAIIQLANHGIFPDQHNINVLIQMKETHILKRILNLNPSLNIEYIPNTNNIHKSNLQQTIQICVIIFILLICILYYIISFVLS